MSDAGVNCTAIYNGLAIDVGRQKLYYADSAYHNGKLGELSTDGTGDRVLVAVNNSRTRSVVIDDVNRLETLFCTSVCNIWKSRKCCL